MIKDLPGGAVVMQDRSHILDRSVVIKGDPQHIPPPRTPAKTKDVAPVVVVPESTAVPPESFAPMGRGGIKNEDIGVSEWYQVDTESNSSGSLSRQRKPAGCTVFLPACLRSLTLVNLHRATIYAGPVSGPIYVDGCSSCLIIAAGHQVRA